MKPEITVIIPTFNRAHTLKRAIDSVMNQTYFAFELIVIDDGSTDQTREMISHCERRAQLGARQPGDREIASASPRNDKLRYIQSNQNRGVSHARNLGIQKAQGKWVAFLDSDDEWLPKKLEIQTEFFKKNPECLIAQTEEIWIRNGMRVNPMKKHQKYSGWIFKQCLPLCVVSPSAVMIKKALFSEVGFFDESLPACEDYDLWLRISAKHPIGLIETPLIIKYGGHDDQLSRTIPNLDVYRIYSMKKLLDSEILTPEQAEWTKEELQKKCRVYANGCEKRGKLDEAEKYRLISSAAHNSKQHQK